MLALVDRKEQAAIKGASTTVSGVHNGWDAATAQICSFLILAQIDLFSTVFIFTASDCAVSDEAENLSVE